jgi:uncharacterized membrane protein
METTDNLKKIINRQKEVLKDLELERDALESSDLIKENAELKSELEKLRAEMAQVRSESDLLTDDNARLKNELYEQIYNEKVKIVNTTAQKIDAFFRANMDGELNRLHALEYDVVNRINYMRGGLEWNSVPIQDEMYARLNELQYYLNAKLTEARAKIYAEQASGAFTQQERDRLEALKQEQISDEQIRAVTSKNNLERFVGLNVLNVVGILLLIVGAIALALFAFYQLTDLMKGIMLFALGGVMLTAGEIRNRKKPNVFSLGLSAGGIGILYVAMVMGSFTLGILDTYAAAGVCLAITAGAFFLATRYSSQLIVVFALVGGYLPIFAIGSDINVTFGAMVYFVVLNLFVLLISFRKKWRAPTFIGLSLNIIGTTYICLAFHLGNDALEKTFVIIYVMFAFLIYTSIPIVSTYRTKSKFFASDIVLLSINTVASSLIMFAVFAGFGFEKYYGLLAIIFALIYLIIGKLIDVKFEGQAPNVKVLFYLTGLAFVVLFVPLQFGEVWLSLGWLVEGVLLTVYGIIAGKKRFTLAGFIICMLCLLAFLIADCPSPEHYLFVYKYLAITIGSLVILGACMYKKLMHERRVKEYKYFALVNVWVFAIYLIAEKLWGVLYEKFDSGDSFMAYYFLGAAMILVTFLLAFAFLRIKPLYDTGIKIISIVLYLIGIVALFVINTASSPVAPRYFQPETPVDAMTIAGTAILIALCALSVLALRDLLKIIVMDRKLSIEMFPLFISGYIVIILTQCLITQYGMSFSSAAISIIYVLTALAWIVFGFRQRYSTIRKFGLGLAIFSVIKLFLIDLYDLAEGYRIISYFALGGTLIAISFVYQYFSKKLDALDTKIDEK